MRSDQITVGVNERGLLHSLPDSEDTESEPDDADEPEEVILEYYPVSGADCATAQFEAIFDPRSVGDIKLPGQFFAVSVQPLRRRWCRSAHGLGHRIP